MYLHIYIYICIYKAWVRGSRNPVGVESAPSWIRVARSVRAFCAPFGSSGSYIWESHWATAFASHVHLALSHVHLAPCTRILRTARLMNPKAGS